MSYFSMALQNLVDIGLVDVLLPFLLVFTIIFAVLQKSEILGKGKRNFNIAVSFVIALLVIVDGRAVEIMNKAIPNVGIVVVSLVMFLILVGLFGGKAKWLGGTVSGWIAIVSFGTIVYIFGAAADWWGHGRSVWWLRWMDDPQTMATVLILLIFGVVIWFITRDDEKKDDKDGFAKGLGDLLKGD